MIYRVSATIVHIIALFTSPEIFRRMFAKCRRTESLVAGAVAGDHVGGFAIGDDAAVIDPEDSCAEALEGV